MSTTSRIPCLDGLRAISISLVVLHHLFHAELQRAGDLGNLGVRMFFVISGFLITTLLMTEIDRTGRISLSDFYVRRTFRIFPAFYVYIAVIALASALGWVALERHDLLAAATYTMNYHPRRAWDIGHLWSLAVEEQFYLVWPLAFSLLSKRRAVWLAVAVMCAAPIVRVATHELLPHHRVSIGESFETIADSLATGCALALVRGRVSASSWVARTQRHGATPIALVAVAVVANSFRPHIAYGYSIGETIVNVSLALVVDACVRNPTTLTGRLLELRPLVFVGTLSYSIYLWQQPLMPSAGHPPLTSLPQNLVVLAALALVSHYAIERPMLDVRKRLTRFVKASDETDEAKAQTR